MLAEFHHNYFDVGVIDASLGYPTFTSKLDVCDDRDIWSDPDYHQNSSNPEPKEYRADHHKRLIAWFGWPSDQTLQEPAGKELSFHATRFDPNAEFTLYIPLIFK